MFSKVNFPCDHMCPDMTFKAPTQLKRKIQSNLPTYNTMNVNDKEYQFRYKTELS